MDAAGTHHTRHTRAEVLTAAERAQVCTDCGLLFLRLALGAIFIAHGSQKVFGWFGGHGLAGTATFMGGLGIPAPLAYIASFAEFLGGIAVLIGLLGRIGALGLVIDMGVAIAMVHFKNGFFADKGGFEYPLALLGMALCVMVAGPGRLAVADVEGRWFGREEPDAEDVADTARAA